MNLKAQKNQIYSLIGCMFFFPQKKNLWFPPPPPQQVSTEDCNKHLLDKINEVANRKIAPTHGSKHTVELLSLRNQDITQTCFRKTTVLVVGGLAHAMYTDPWDHLPGLVSTLPTVEKHLISPLNNRFESEKSNRGSNLLQSNFDWPWCYFVA